MNVPCLGPEEQSVIMREVAIVSCGTSDCETELAILISLISTRMDLMHIQVTLSEGRPDPIFAGCGLDRTSLPCLIIVKSQANIDWCYTNPDGPPTGSIQELRVPGWDMTLLAGTTWRTSSAMILL